MKEVSSRALFVVEENYSQQYYVEVNKTKQWKQIRLLLFKLRKGWPKAHKLHFMSRMEVLSVSWRVPDFSSQSVKRTSFDSKFNGENGKIFFKCPKIFLKLGF